MADISHGNTFYDTFHFSLVKLDFINERGNFHEEGNMAILPPHENFYVYSSSKNGIYFHDVD